MKRNYFKPEVEELVLKAESSFLASQRKNADFDADDLDDPISDTITW